MSEIINNWFFNKVGIVKVHDSFTNEDKFYIGEIKGQSEKEDVEYIKNWGAKFFPNMIK